MKQNNFEKESRKSWKDIEKILDRSSKKTVHNKSFPALYRKVCRDLAIARSRNYSATLISQLEDLVQRGHEHLYGRKGRQRFSILNYFGREFPALIRKEWRLVLLSHFFFYGPLLLLIVIIQFYPHIAYMILPENMISQMEMMYDPSSNFIQDRRTASGDVYMLGYYIRNNVGIDFQCFAGGIFAGVGSIFFMLYNGLFIGAVAGHLTQIGYSETFWSFVCGHAALELTAAVFAGASGMKMGFALINPGQLTRFESLKKSAGVAMKILYGTAFMTFLAAFVEAFWSSSPHISNSVKYTFSICFWIALAVYFLFAGRGYEPE